MAAEGKNYKLNCFIQGDQNMRAFSIPHDAEVKELWQVICREGQLQCRLTDLALFKVDMDLEPPIELKIDDGQLLSDLWREQPPLKHLHIFARVCDRGEKPATSQSSSKEIPDVVGQSSHKRRRLDNSGAEETSHEAEKRIEQLEKHIERLEKEKEELVRRFASMEMDAPDFLWLRELHENLWSREELKLKLFRKVKVSRAHYDKFQARLDRKYQGRDVPQDEDHRPNVLTYKLKILKSFAARHPDNHEDLDDGDSEAIDEVDNPEAINEDNDRDVIDEDGDSEAIDNSKAIDNSEPIDEDDDPEALDEDGFEINSCFPFTLNYLDLSPLKLQNMSDRFPSPLFIRKEYHLISKLIEGRFQDSTVIVSGQPGTGKTAYLYLRIIDFLIAGRPFLYQSEEGDVYHITEDGVEAIRSPMLPKEHIVAFIDGDRGNTSPNRILRNPLIQMIVASSPKGAYNPWIKQKGQLRHVVKLATSLWSHDELFLTGIFLHPFDINAELLRKSTVYFGYNPRQCFEASHSWEELNMKIKDVGGHISRVAAETANILQELYSYRNGNSDMSHTIFQLSPINDSRRLEECQYEAVSQWAFDYLLEICERKEADAATVFYRALTGQSWAASLRGRLFERRVLNDLDEIDDVRELRIRGLTHSGEMTWTYRGPIQRSTFQEPAVIKYNQRCSSDQYATASGTLIKQFSGRRFDRLPSG